MDDDKPTEPIVTPAPPPGQPRKRPPPTIDLKASNVSDTPAKEASSEPAASTEEQVPPPSEQASPSDASSPAPEKKARALAPILVAAASGAVASCVVLGAAWFAMSPGGKSDRSRAAQTQAAVKSDLDTLNSRIAKIETRPNSSEAPAADAASAARLDTLEKSIASLRDDVASARSAIDALKAAPRETVAPDMSAIEERIAKIERATVALTGELKPADVKANEAKSQEDDLRLRLVAVAASLDTSVRQSEPYAATLATARSLAGDVSALKPLDAFADKGVPSASALNKELLSLLPQLAPRVPVEPAPSGVFDRLQQGASRFVRVERVDPVASETAAIVARIASAAQRDDLGAARREANNLPQSARAVLQPWIEKADAREAALGCLETVCGRHVGGAGKDGAIGPKMIRIILFLFLIGLVALGAAIVADQSGSFVLLWNGWRIERTVPEFVLTLVVIIVLAILVWSSFRGVLRIPSRIRRHRHEKRIAKGRHAITQGLIAIGTGDHFAARYHADVARRLAHQDPLALLLHAQSAQLNGDRDGAQRAFHTLAEREDTRLLGLRGLFVEAQRRDDAMSAVALAEEALKVAPGSAWASQAVLGFRCSRGDWNGALKILDNDLASGLIDPAPFKRQRGVLLTARALELESGDRDLARESIMEAVKLAPTLVPAATLAAKFLSEDNQTRRAMRIVEAAWAANPHPDLADAYAHIRLGDSAVQRLSRVEALADKVPGHIEGALALARAAIDAAQFAKARAALEPFTEIPTQRVALLMAELERAESGDNGRARAWMLRAVRAAHDPVWIADGYVSDRWRPVSPVTGRIDAFQWLTPVAALPSDKTAMIDAEIADDALLIALAEPTTPVTVQDNAPKPIAQTAPQAAPVLPEAAPAQPAVFRPRRDIEKPDSAKIPPVIPVVRAPDDPGVPDTGLEDEYDSANGPDRGQTGGWRGFLTRLVS